MQFLRCSAPHLTFCSFMQTGTQFTWKTLFSFVDVKIDGVDFGPPCLSIVNTKLLDDEWTLRTNKSQVRYLRPVANLHSSIRTISAAPLRSLPPSDEPSRFFYRSRPPTTFSLSNQHHLQWRLLNRPGPLRPDHVLPTFDSAAPNLVSGLSLQGVLLYTNN